MFFSKKKDTTWTSSVEERMAKYEVHSLEEEEMLSTLTGLSTEQAKEYIDRYGILELPKFVDHLDITQTQKNKIKFLYQFTSTLATHELVDKLEVSDTGTACKLFVERLKFCRYEVFELAFLDMGNKVIHIQRLSEGTLNETAVYIRTILELALKYNAKNIILSHNHTDDRPEPSDTDKKITKGIVAALGLISINVIDHIVVAGNKYFSFAEKGLI